MPNGSDSVGALYYDVGVSDQAVTNLLGELNGVIKTAQAQITKNKLTLEVEVGKSFTDAAKATKGLTTELTASQKAIKTYGASVKEAVALEKSGLATREQTAKTIRSLTGEIKAQLGSLDKLGSEHRDLAKAMTDAGTAALKLETAQARANKVFQDDEVRQYRDQLSNLRTEFERGATSRNDFITDTQRLQKEMLELRGALDPTTKAFGQLDRVIGTSARNLDTAAGRISKLGLSQQIAIGFTGQLSNSLTNLGGVAGGAATLGISAFANAQQRAKDDAEGFRKTTSLLGPALLGVGLIAAGALTAGFIKAGKAAVALESAQAGVAKTTGLGADSLQTLTQNLQGLATTIGTPTKDLLDLAAVAGSLGVNGVDNITQFTETIAKLALATDIVGEEGASQLARFVNVTKEANDTVGASAELVGNVLNRLGNTLPATEAEILAVATRLGQLSVVADASQADILALAGALKSAGIESQLAGGATTRLFIELDEGVRRSGSQLAEYARLTGLTADEFTRLEDQSPVDAFTALIGGLKGAKERGEELVPILKTIGVTSTEERQVMLQLIGSYDTLTQARKDAADEAITQASLEKEVATRLDTVSGQLGILRARFGVATEVVGQSFLPVLKLVTEALIDQPEILGHVAASLIEVVREFVIFGTQVQLVGTQVTGVFVGIEAGIKNFVDNLSNTKGSIGTGLQAIGQLVQGNIAEYNRLTAESAKLAPFNAQSLEDSYIAYNKAYASVAGGAQAQADTALKVLNERLGTYEENVKRVTGQAVVLSKGLEQQTGKTLLAADAAGVLAAAQEGLASLDGASQADAEAYLANLKGLANSYPAIAEQLSPLIIQTENYIGSLGTGIGVTEDAATAASSTATAFDKALTATQDYVYMLSQGVQQGVRPFEGAMHLLTTALERQETTQANLAKQGKFGANFQLAAEKADLLRAAIEELTGIKIPDPGIEAAYAPVRDIVPEVEALVTAAKALPIPEVTAFAGELKALPIPEVKAMAGELQTLVLPEVTAEYEDFLTFFQLDLVKALTKSADTADLFGESFNATAEEADRVRAEIERLLKEGLEPSDKEVQELSKRYKELTTELEATEKANKNYQDNLETTRDAQAGLADVSSLTREAISQLLKDLGPAAKGVGELGKQARKAQADLQQFAKTSDTFTSIIGAVEQLSEVFSDLSPAAEAGLGAIADGAQAAFDAFNEGASAGVQIAEGLSVAINALSEAMGEDLDKATQLGLQGVSQFADGVAKLASGDILGGATSLLGSFISLLSSGAEQARFSAEAIDKYGEATLRNAGAVREGIAGLIVDPAKLAEFEAGLERTADASAKFAEAQRNIQEELRKSRAEFAALSEELATQGRDLSQSLAESRVEFAKNTGASDASVFIAETILALRARAAEFDVAMNDLIDDKIKLTNDYLAANPGASRGEAEAYAESVLGPQRDALKEQFAKDSASILLEAGKQAKQLGLSQKEFYTAVFEGNTKVLGNMTEGQRLALIQFVKTARELGIELPAAISDAYGKVNGAQTEAGNAAGDAIRTTITRLETEQANLNNAWATRSAELQATIRNGSAAQVAAAREAYATESAAYTQASGQLELTIDTQYQALQRVEGTGADGLAAAAKESGAKIQASLDGIYTILRQVLGEDANAIIGIIQGTYDKQAAAHLAGGQAAAAGITEGQKAQLASLDQVYVVLREVLGPDANAIIGLIQNTYQSQADAHKTGGAEAAAAATAAGESQRQSIANINALLDQILGEAAGPIKALILKSYNDQAGAHTEGGGTVGKALEGVKGTQEQQLTAIYDQLRTLLGESAGPIIDAISQAAGAQADALLTGETTVTTQATTSGTAIGGSVSDMFGAVSDSVTTLSPTAITGIKDSLGGLTSSINLDGGLLRDAADTAGGFLSTSLSGMFQDVGGAATLYGGAADTALSDSLSGMLGTTIGDGDDLKNALQSQEATLANRQKEFFLQQKIMAGEHGPKAKRELEEQIANQQKQMQASLYGANGFSPFLTSSTTDISGLLGGFFSKQRDSVTTESGKTVNAVTAATNAIRSAMFGLTSASAGAPGGSKAPGGGGGGGAGNPNVFQSLNETVDPRALGGFGDDFNFHSLLYGNPEDEFGQSFSREPFGYGTSANVATAERSNYRGTPKGNNFLKNALGNLRRDIDVFKKGSVSEINAAIKTLSEGKKKLQKEIDTRTPAKGGGKGKGGKGAAVPDDVKQTIQATKDAIAAFQKDTFDIISGGSLFSVGKGGKVGGLLRALLGDKVSFAKGLSEAQSATLDFAKSFGSTLEQGVSSGLSSGIKEAIRSGGIADLSSVIDSLFSSTFDGLFARVSDDLLKTALGPLLTQLTAKVTKGNVAGAAADAAKIAAKLPQVAAQIQAILAPLQGLAGLGSAAQTPSSTSTGGITLEQRSIGSASPSWMVQFGVDMSRIADRIYLASEKQFAAALRFEQAVNRTVTNASQQRLVNGVTTKFG